MTAEFLEPRPDDPCAVGRDFRATKTNDDLDWANLCPNPSGAWFVYQQQAMRVCEEHGETIQREFAQQLQDTAASIESARPLN